MRAEFPRSTRSLRTPRPTRRTPSERLEEAVLALAGELGDAAAQAATVQR